MRCPLLCTTALGLALTAPVAGQAATYVIESFTELNSSGVSGGAVVVHDEPTNMLRVTLDVRGIAPGFEHLQHIHGLVEDGVNLDSTTPPASAAGPDGILSISDGFPFYGPVILPLTPFPEPRPDGSYLFDQTYDLSDPDVFADGFDASALFPLDLREIVLHGGFVPVNDQNDRDDDDSEDDDDMDGFVFRATLPVAAGEMVLQDDTPTPIPLPAAGWALVAGLGALVGLGRRRG